MSITLLSQGILVIEFIWEINTVSLHVHMPPSFVACDKRWLLHDSDSAHARAV